MLKIDSPEKFWKTIPRTIPENIAFRQKLHSELVKDKEAQKVFLELCYLKPEIAFDSCLWTYNPKEKPFKRNLPFILRPQQIISIQEIFESIREGHDLLLDKSRDEGATEIICKAFALESILVPETSFLVGSRKEEFVDLGTQLAGNRVSGSPKCLFHKILYTYATIPLWMKPNVVKTHMHIEISDNGSVIDGEATNESFGAGDRRTGILLDEFGRVDYKLAQNIRETVSDVTDAVIYNSTHFYGMGHPFAQLRFSGKIKVITLPWHKNPNKNFGMYRSPDLNKIVLFDDYYKKNYPGCFDNIEIGKPFKFSDLEIDLLSKGKSPDVNFIADGVDKLTSPWRDREVLRRDPRDVAQNIDMEPGAAGDNFFDRTGLIRMRNERIREPNYEGEIEYKSDPITNKMCGIRFRSYAGKNRFSWWGDLTKNRPNQNHNYIVSCDISLGAGVSNSVAGVYDVNTHEKVGTFVSPDLPPEEFADQVIAICHWVGGLTRKPFLIWEANGPGISFDKRVQFHNYNFVYFLSDERSIQRRGKSKRRRGWYNTKKSKYDLLLELRTALNEGLKTNPILKSLIVYDEDTISEYERYLFLENGDIGFLGSADESSGAKLTHADRVIADGLAVIAMSDVKKAAINEQQKVLDEFCLGYRMFLAKRKKEQDRRSSPWL